MAHKEYKANCEIPTPTLFPPTDDSDIDPRQLLHEMNFDIEITDLTTDVLLERLLYHSKAKHINPMLEDTEDIIKIREELKRRNRNKKL